jgi:hypothetical protein
MGSKSGTPRRTRFQADLAPSDELPEINLPRVSIKWTRRELESLADLVTSEKASRRTAALIRALRD